MQVDKRFMLHVPVGLHLNEHRLTGRDDDNDRLKHDSDGIKHREPTDSLHRSAGDIMVNRISLKKRHRNIYQCHDDIEYNDNEQIECIGTKERKNLFPDL